MVWHHEQCTNVCQFREISARAEAAQGIVHEMSRITKGVGTVSSALWCDRGGHAFSVNDKGRKHFTETSENPDTGESETQIYDVCGECNSKIAFERRSLPSATQD